MRILPSRDYSHSQRVHFSMQYCTDIRYNVGLGSGMYSRIRTTNRRGAILWVINNYALCANAHLGAGYTSCSVHHFCCTFLPILSGTNTTQGKTCLKRKFEYILCLFWDGFSSIHSGWSVLKTSIVFLWTFLMWSLWWMQYMPEKS